MINETLTHLKECYDKQTLIIKEAEQRIADADKAKDALLETFTDNLLEYLSANFTRKWMREIAPYSNKEIYHFVISFEKGSGDCVIAMSSQTLYATADKELVVENARYSMCRSIYINCGDASWRGLAWTPWTRPRLQTISSVLTTPRRGTNYDL